MPEISVSGGSVVESSSSVPRIPFDITLSEPAPDVVRVGYRTVDGTADRFIDYGLISGTLEFGPGEQTLSLLVAVEDRDDLDEGDESVYLELFDPQEATLAGGGLTLRALGVIEDDDGSSLDRALFTPDIYITESDAGTRNAVVTIELSEASASRLEFPYTTYDITAVAGEDYEAVSGLVDFAPGATQATVTIPVFGDTDSEITERFGLAVTTDSAIANGSDGASGVITILDDDSGDGFGGIISVDGGRIVEDSSSVPTIPYTIILSEPSLVDVSVDYRTRDGTALRYVDYDGQAGTVTFAPGETLRTIFVAVEDRDTVVEPDESVVLELRNPVNGVFSGEQALISAQGFIKDDDGAGAKLGLFASHTVVPEPDDGDTVGVFDVVLSEPFGSTLAIPYRTIGIGAVAGEDFEAASGVLTFLPGQTRHAVPVRLFGDRAIEPTESIALVFDAPSQIRNTSDGPAGLLTILDNDSPSGRMPVLSVSGGRVTESANSVPLIEYVVALSEAVTTSVSVEYEAYDGTATETSDYSDLIGTLTFAPGEQFKSLFLTVEDGDSTDEADESVYLELTDPTNAILTGNAPRLRALGIIQDDDGVGPNTALFTSDPVILEPDAGLGEARFDVVLSRPFETDQRFAYTTADGSALAGTDYTPRTGSIDFAAGQLWASVPVPVLGDGLAEPAEGFDLVVSTNALIRNETDGAAGRAIIFDDDAAGSDVTLSVSGGRVVESASSVPQIEYTVSLSQPSLAAVTVQYRTLDGTARETVDYFGTSGTLVFSPNTTSQTIRVTVEDRDSRDEADESVYLELFNPAFATFANNAQSLRATGIILDDDGLGPNRALFVDDIEIVEGDDGQRFARFEAILSQPATATLDIGYALVSGSARAGSDFNALSSGVLTFRPGQTSTSLFIPVTGDGSAELNETLSLVLTPPPSIANGIDGAAGLATILDDDTDDQAPSLWVRGGQTVESESSVPEIRFDVFLSGPTSAEVRVGYRTIDGAGVHGALDTVDYFGRSGTLVIAPGQTSASVEVVLEDRDTEDERDEYFVMEFFDPAGAVFAGSAPANRAAGIILDDDGGGSNTSVFLPDPQILEPSGPSGERTVDLHLSQPVASEITFTYEILATGTAQPGLDIALESGTASILPGQTRVAIPITVFNEGVAESAETFGLQLTNITGAPFSFAGSTFFEIALLDNALTDDGVPDEPDPFEALIDLARFGPEDGVLITGIGTGDNAGTAVASAGDINGDGIDDFVVSAPFADSGGISNTGKVYVVFGDAGGLPPQFGLEGLNGTNGFVITGSNAEDRIGASIASAGDFNKDGFDDLIIGASSADPNGVSGAGESYILFGRPTFAPFISTDQISGQTGLTVAGAETFGGLGISVDGAGDTNGDGFDDVILGAWQVDDGSESLTGAAYVVFGGTAQSDAPLDVRALDGDNGYTILGAERGDRAGFTVAGGGDVDGDGFADVVLSALGVVSSSSVTGTDASSSYVVFGSAQPDAVQRLDALGSSNAVALGGVEGLPGLSLDIVGDLNADGLDDLVLGAPGDGFPSDTPGAVYVLFGNSGRYGSRVDLSQLDGLNGFTIDGIDPRDETGQSVASAGDVNGDGIDDLLIGAPQADKSEASSAGRAYVVFGTSAGFDARLDLASLDGSNGIMFFGADAFDDLGGDVSRAGDLNQDGYADIILGAPLGDPLGRSGAGEAYVVFGRPSAQSDTVPVINLSEGASFLEGDAGSTAISLQATRLGGSTGRSTVDYAVIGIGENAASPGDFVGGVFPSGTIEFLDGDLRKVIDIPIAGDLLFEERERFLVVLSNPVNASVLGEGTAEIAIRDDDSLYSISSLQVETVEGDAASATVTVTIDREVPNIIGGNPPVVTTSTLDYRVVGSGPNPADADDFGGVLPSGTITFVDQATTQVIPIEISGDTDLEPDETFTIEIFNASDGSVGVGTATGTIRNDDTESGDMSDPFENNDSFDEAADLGVIDGRRIEDELVVSSGDEDWYRFELAARGRRGDGISLTHDALIGNASLDLELYNADGDRIAFSNSPFGFESISLAGFDVEPLWIRVRLENSDAEPSYALTITGPDALPTGGPVAVLDRRTIGEEQAVLIDALRNDDAQENGPLVVVAINGRRLDPDSVLPLASGAQASITADGLIAYDPGQTFDYLPAGAQAIDRFIYTVEDAAGETAIGTVTLTIQGENDPPVANDDLAATLASEPVTVSVLANDIDPDFDPLSVAMVDGTPVTPNETIALTSGALVTVGADGRIVYDPNGQFDALGSDRSAIDEFRYTVRDAGDLTDTAAVRIDIDGVDLTPVFDLAAYWPADVNDGRSLVDLTGSVLNGSLVGGADTTDAGYVGSGLIFDGETGRIVIPHTGSLLLDEGAASFWINPNRLGVDQGLVSKDAAGSGTGGHVDIALLPDGTVSARLQGQEAGVETILASAPVAAGAWTHIAFAWGPDGAQLYVNGALVDADPAFVRGLGPSSGGSGNAEPLLLGASGRQSDDRSAEPVSRFFEGRIDEVALLSSQPSPADVAALYDAGRQGQGLAVSTPAVDIDFEALLQEWSPETASLPSLLWAAMDADTGLAAQLIAFNEALEGLSDPVLFS